MADCVGVGYPEMTRCTICKASFYIGRLDTLIWPKQNVGISVRTFAAIMWLFAEGFRVPHAAEVVGHLHYSPLTIVILIG